MKYWQNLRIESVKDAKLDFLEDVSGASLTPMIFSHGLMGWAAGYTGQF